MQNSPSGRVRPGSGRCLRARSQTLRRASLLIGTSFLLQVAPARAANECGPPPPGGGTVTCPPGVYPDGIRYVTVDDLEVLLQPGVTVFNGTSVQSSGELRFVGPTDTSLNQTSNTIPQTAALRLLSGGTIFADVDDVFSSVDDLPAVSILSIGAVTFFADTVTTAALRAPAVEVFQDAPGPPMPGPQGDVDVRVNAITTTGGGSGGISAFSSQRDVRVSAGSITISGSGTGISASANNFQFRGLTAFVDAQTIQTNGQFSRGIVVSANNIEIRSGTIVTVGNQSAGIDARATEEISIRSERIETTGSASPGIVAVGELGDIAIDSDSISTAGTDSQGISVVDLIDADITIRSGTVTTLGPLADGIFARSTEGDVTVISGTVVTQDNGSIGIEAASESGDIAIESGTITTAGFDTPAIRASTGPGSVGITSGAVTTAHGSEGIDASSDSGDIDITSGSVVVQGFQNGFALKAGIQASSIGGDITIVSDSITAEAISGILATNFDGSITVTAGPIGTLEDSAHGVVTFVNRSGTTFIRTGSITTHGFDSFGVVANSIGMGAVEVISDGTIVTTGGSSPGISAGSGGAVTVSANNISTSGANSDAIAVKGSTSSVTIRGLVQSSQGFAVRGDGGVRQLAGPGGPMTVNILGGGTLRGRVSLTGAVDQISNSGTFDAIGISQFGAGADSFDNGPGGIVLSVNGSATFADLESFTNRGLVDLRDGATGDSLTLAGAYSGAGAARLGLDVDLTSGIADRLVTGAATGSTTIDLQATGQAADLMSSILLVDAGAGTSATAFALGAGVADTPYLRTTLSFEPAGNDFFLVQAPGAAVFETARFAAMAAHLWYESADAVAAQLDTARDGRGGRGIGLWLQAWSGEHERDGTQVFAATGDTFDISYEQDFHGLQGGVDLQTGTVAVGLTAGVGRSDAAFLATGNPVDMEVSNIGAYVQGRSGLLFFNALAKFDRAELEIDPGAGLGASFDADLFGVQANAGVRLGFGSVFAEPSVGLSWVQTEVEAFASGPATVGPGEGESLRARAGLRVGARLPLGGGALLPFVAVNAYEELSGENSSDFTLGETLRLFDEPAGTRGQAAAGVSFVAGRFEAFVRGDIDFSGESDSKSLRAGARLRF